MTMDRENIPIRKARKTAGFTQKEMSEYLGIPLRTIENWEMGVNSPSKWAEKLIIEKLEQYSNERNQKKEE